MSYIYHKPHDYKMATTYSQKLKDPRWQRRRLEILERDNFTCQYCNDSEHELHVHHWSYSTNPWETDADDLTTLCKQCHYIIEDCIAETIVVCAVNKTLFSTGRMVCFVRTDRGMDLYLFDEDGCYDIAFSYGKESIEIINSFVNTINESLKPK